ncbi:MAG: response regulator [Spirochaetales bacterium]|nr:response regulator [Spirochaetales bacterium]
MNNEQENKFKILIVDDNNENRQLIASLLKAEGIYDITLAADGFSALKSINKNQPDLLILDIMMPGINGFEVAGRLKQDKKTESIPILVITALTDIDGMTTAFEMGASDYITKPFRKQELLSRVKAQMERKRMYDELKFKNRLLEDKRLLLMQMVDEKTIELENMTIALITSLENANLFNDTDTGEHIRRVSEYSRAIAREYFRTTPTTSAAEQKFANDIKRFASLHDVGKVGISDSLLKKPGIYTEKEFNAMKQHVILGAKMLSSPVIPQMAQNIILYHHERWDGTGYTHNLAGDKIPLEARIVALADVYDALGTKRVYKKAFKEDQIDEIIRNESGKHFDPYLVKIYFRIKTVLREIKQNHQQ